MKIKNKVFEASYSQYYDKIYSRKNYKDEVIFLDSIFKEYKRKKPVILDVGCGTGEHLIELLKLGYNVIGIDNSQHMLDLARIKLKDSGFIKTKLLKMNANNIHKTNFKFDIVIIMFNVVGYLNNFELFFKNLKKVLNKNAIIFFDFWCGEAIKKNKPKISNKKYTFEDCLLTKRSVGKLIEHDTVKVDIDIKLRKKNKIYLDKETHYIRYFFFDYLKITLSKIGYEVIFLDTKKIRKIMNSKSKWEAMCLLKNNG